jgi:hypothetical protein
LEPLGHGQAAFPNDAAVMPDAFGAFRVCRQAPGALEPSGQLHMSAAVLADDPLEEGVAQPASAPVHTRTAVIAENGVFMWISS